MKFLALISFSSLSLLFAQGPPNLDLVISELERDGIYQYENRTYTAVITDRYGHYTASGEHRPWWLRTYLIGVCDHCERTEELRSFVEFPYYNFLMEPVAQAWFVLALNDFGLGSDTGPETWSVFEVTTPSAEVREGGTGLTHIFEDLGNGVPYGERVVTQADEGERIRMELNPDAIAAINRADSDNPILMGSRVTSLSDNPAREYIFLPGEDRIAMLAMLTCRFDGIDLEGSTLTLAGDCHDTVLLRKDRHTGQIDVIQEGIDLDDVAQIQLDTVDSDVFYGMTYKNDIDFSDAIFTNNATVPTLSEWGLFIFVFMLMAAALMQRRLGSTSQK